MVMMLGVDYRVLVGTDDEIVMMHGGRLRQVATSVVGRVSSDVAIEPVGNNLVMTQWQIGDEHYSVMKRFQSDMVAIAQMSSD